MTMNTPDSQSAAETGNQPQGITAPTGFTPLSPPPEEVIKLDKEGFHYRGEFIADAGKAHRLFVKFMERSLQPRDTGILHGGDSETERALETRNDPTPELSEVIREMCERTTITRPKEDKP
jgi:hypothetical protein